MRAGRSPYRSIQTFADAQAAKLGIRARRWRGTATIESVAMPMGIPPEWPVAKILAWKKRAAQGKPVPWIVSGPDGRHKRFESRPLSRDTTEAGAKRPPGAPHKLTPEQLYDANAERTAINPGS